MKVGIIQSSYLPWRGYLDFIASVDLFVILDDVQFTRQDWRNRNRIKTPGGSQWITVPVHRQGLSARICEAEIDYARNWRHDHRRAVALNYARASHTPDVLAMLDAAFDANHPTISALNIALLRSLCGYLGIQTPLRLSSDFACAGVKTDRLLALLTAVGATTYLSGPSARAYLEEDRFREAGIALEYKRYHYPDYPQLWGPFDGVVSVIDLIANCGPDARALITSGVADQAAAAA
jgi:hypothetical protein